MAGNTDKNACSRLLQMFYIDCFTDPILEHRDFVTRMESFASWSKAVLCLTLVVIVGSIWWWFDGGPCIFFKICLYSARVIVSSTSVLFSQRLQSLKHMRLSTACCVLSVTATFMLISLENPEVMVSQHCLPGTPEENTFLALKKVEERLSNQDFQSFMSSLMHFVRNASDAGHDVYPISCAATVASKLPNLDSTIPSWQGSSLGCKQRNDFSYNFMVGQAYLLSAAVMSGLTTLHFMLSWCLCQTWAVWLFYTRTVSMQLWVQNHVLIIAASFLSSLCACNYLEKHRRIGTLLSADSTLVSMSLSAIKARQQWIQKISASSLWGKGLVSALRREGQLRNILAVSVDAIGIVAVCQNGTVKLLFQNGSLEAERFESLVGQAVPKDFNDIVVDRDKGRWNAYALRCLSAKEPSSSLEMIRIELQNAVVEAVLSVDHGNHAVSFLALRHVKPTEFTTCSDVDMGAEFPEHIPLTSCDGPSDCISKDCRVMLANGWLEPATNLLPGHRVLAVDITSGEIVQSTVTSIEQASASSGPLMQVQCTNGVSTTCTPDHIVARRGAINPHEQVSAANLCVGDQVTVCELRQETVVSVKGMQDELATVLAINLDQAGLNIFVADPCCRATMAVRPNMYNVGERAPMDDMTQGLPVSTSCIDSDDGDARSWVSSSLVTSSSSDGKTVIKIGPRRTPNCLLLSSIASVPRQTDGRLTSMGSLRHGKQCKPCQFHVRKKGCADGPLCDQCHWPHEMTYAARNRAPRNVAQDCNQVASNMFLARLNTDQVEMYCRVKNTFYEVLPPSTTLIRRVHSAPCMIGECGEGLKVTL